MRWRPRHSPINIRRGLAVAATACSFVLSAPGHTPGTGSSCPGVHHLKGRRLVRAYLESRARETRSGTTVAVHSNPSRPPVQTARVCTPPKGSTPSDFLCEPIPMAGLRASMLCALMRYSVRLITFRGLLSSLLPRHSLACTRKRSLTVLVQVQAFDVRAKQGNSAPLQPGCLLFTRQIRCRAASSVASWPRGR